jgi:hypothetical protein
MASPVAFALVGRVRSSAGWASGRESFVSELGSQPPLNVSNLCRLSTGLGCLVVLGG